jgi:hypothetical protein
LIEIEKMNKVIKEAIEETRQVDNEIIGEHIVQILYHYSPSSDKVNRNYEICEIVFITKEGNYISFTAESDCCGYATLGVDPLFEDGHIGKIVKFTKENLELNKNKEIEKQIIDYYEDENRERYLETYMIKLTMENGKENKFMLIGVHNGYYSPQLIVTKRSGFGNRGIESHYYRAKIIHPNE